MSCFHIQENKLDITTELREEKNIVNEMRLKTQSR